MFSLLRLEIGMMVRTTRSLLRLSRNDEMDILRELEELDKVLRPELAKDATSGDVDILVKDFTKWEDRVDKATKHLELDEARTFIAELRDDKKVPPVSLLLKRVNERLSEVGRMHLSDPATAKMVENWTQKFRVLSQRIHQIEQQDYDTLKAEYTALMRQKTGEKGELQNAVWNIAPVMEALAAQWHLRGQSRTEANDQKALKRELKHFLTLLEQMYSGRNKPEVVKRCVEQLKNDEEKFERQFAEFSTMLEHITREFLLVMKTLALIYFRIKDERDGEKKYLDVLGTSGFPPNDLHALQAKMLKHELKENAILEDYLKALARGRRKVMD